MLEDEQHNEQELRESAPFLFSLEKTEVTPPEGYLEGLTDTIFDKIESQKDTEVVPLQHSSGLKWAIAASILALLALTFVLQSTAPVSMQEGIGFETDLELDEDMLLAMDESLIYEVYLEDLETEETGAEIDFLLDNNLDYDDLIEEL